MTDAPGPVRPGDELDWPGLARYLRARLDLPSSPMEVRQFTGGQANLTYLLELGEQRLVLRRPPRGPLAPGSHDMAREHRVLSRLSTVFPRAPRSLHYCCDPGIIGAPFVIVEHREGEVVRQQVPAAMAHHDDVERRMCLALVDAMADLHAVDVDAAGLGELGHPDGFGTRQVSGWLDRWRRVAPDGDAGTMEEIGTELGRRVPAPLRTSVVHNDLKLDNCQFAAGDPDTVTSLFDWDMATVGDPLFDVANLVVSTEHLPVWVLSAAEVADRYADRTGAAPSDLRWYEAFARWRTAVVVQQLFDRYARGESTDDRLAPLGRLVPDIAARARAVLDGGTAGGAS